MEWARNQSELAVALGLRSASVIKGYLVRGAPEKTERGYPIADWKRWFDENVETKHRSTKMKLRVAGGKPPNGSGGEYNPPDYADGLHEKKLYEETRIRELQRKKEEGHLVDRAAMVQLMQRHIIHARVIQETIPESISMLIGDPELRQLVKSEAARILADSHRALTQAVEDMESE